MTANKKFNTDGQEGSGLGYAVQAIPLCTTLGRWMRKTCKGGGEKETK